ncbi:unnamed protein product [Effrenium voratum]|uniref:Uncharacterized protein n=1 Tax=Effrenium voratum TaxID=2562239 RepID=A0AA36JH07_9DINO|nr:unnamed protein product [Effrenium voratum]
MFAACTSRFGWDQAQLSWASRVLKDAHQAAVEAADQGSLPEWLQEERVSESPIIIPSPQPLPLPAPDPFLNVDCTFAWLLGVSPSCENATGRRLRHDVFGAGAWRIMEVCLLNAENVPDGCLLSISAGGSRRQAPLAAKQKFAFSNSSFAAAVAAGGSGLKVDLLSVKGSACVGSSELLPGLQKAFGAGSAGEGTGHELEVVMPQAGDEELMKLNFFIKPAKKEDREHDMIPPSGPSTFRESEVMPTDYLKQSVLLDRTLPLPPGPKAHSQSSTMRPSRRHHAALQARSYLEDHNILPFVERLLKTLVQERPVDPWGAIAALLPEVAFPELNKKGQLEKLDEEPEASPKHWNLMPSVGTWYMIPKPAKDQACHASKEDGRLCRHAKRNGRSMQRSRADSWRILFLRPARDLEFIHAAPPQWRALRTPRLSERSRSPSRSRRSRRRRRKHLHFPLANQRSEFRWTLRSSRRRRLARSQTFLRRFQRHRISGCASTQQPRF